MTDTTINPPREKLAKGCRPNPKGHIAGISFRLHPASLVVSTPAETTWRSQGVVPKIKDQGRTGSCTGHATTTCIEATCAAQGRPLGMVLSEVDAYRSAREVERARETPAGQQLPKLEDNGAMPADMMQGIGAFGVRERLAPLTADGRNSDADPTTINDDQTLDELEASAVHVVVGEYTIDPGARDAVALARQSLAAGVMLGIAFFVDTAFEDWGYNFQPGAVPCGAPDITDKTGGGHMIACVDYYTTHDGSTVFVLANSWSEDLGDGGYWYVTEAWFRAAWVIYSMNVRVASA